MVVALLLLFSVLAFFLLFLFVIGFDPPLGTFSGRGDFSLGVNMGSNSIPQKLLRMRV